MVGVHFAQHLLIFVRVVWMDIHFGVFRIGYQHTKLLRFKNHLNKNNLKILHLINNILLITYLLWIDFKITTGGNFKGKRSTLPTLRFVWARLFLRTINQMLYDRKQQSKDFRNAHNGNNHLRCAILCETVWISTVRVLGDMDFFLLAVCCANDSSEFTLKTGFLVGKFCWFEYSKRTLLSSGSALRSLTDRPPPTNINRNDALIS